MPRFQSPRLCPLDDVAFPEIVMLDLLAHGRGLRFCDRLSRRNALRIGGLGSLGLSLSDLLRPVSASEVKRPNFGTAKQVIVLFMWGGPAHQDTWDLKPEAPAEIRGEFRPIDTNVPGIQISEHFPLIARHADKLAIVRSVGNDDNNHSTGAHFALTGRRHALKAESFAASGTDAPHLGSVLNQIRPSRAGLPSFVALPEVIATTNGAITPGQGGGFLGRSYDPFVIARHPDEDDFSVAGLGRTGIEPTRMSGRRGLLDRLDQVRAKLDRTPGVEAMDSFYRQALDMILSPQALRAFDLGAESDRDRFRYGWHTFGQSVLLARRLIEAGVQLVTVYWHREDPTIDSTWDTHAANFEELKNRLMPSVDRPIAALLEDLKARGLLDETLILWTSEFGRTPRINPNAGRDHWGPCNSVVMAGGGVPGGQVYGASDEHAAFPARDAVSQEDVAATVFHLLGVEPEAMIHDRLNRPHPVSPGKPIQKLLAGEAIGSDRTPAAESFSQRLGAFQTMLRERGRRFLGLELGNPASEKQWELRNFAEALSNGSETFRQINGQTASVRYLAHLQNQFRYTWLALRLIEPRPIKELDLRIAGRDVTATDELRSAGPKRIWQIALPDGLLAPGAAIELTANGWKLADLALLGDAIHPRFLRSLA